MTPFDQSIHDAKSVETIEEVLAVLRDVQLRLEHANSAIAVDSAKQVIEALIAAMTTPLAWPKNLA